MNTQVCHKCDKEKVIEAFGILRQNRKTSDNKNYLYCVRKRICKECGKIACKKYYKDNIEKEIKRRKIYNTKNRVKIAKYEKVLRVKRYSTDINFKLSCNLRIRLNRAFKNNYKAGSAVRDLGCSINFLKGYLEVQFKEGMSWNNYGKRGWHIDHKNPLSKFDLSNREEFLKACHFSNLQPMWASENISKGNKIHV